MALFSGLFAGPAAALVKEAKKIVIDINAREEALKALPDSAFPEQTAALKARLEKGETLDQILQIGRASCRERV